MPAKPSRAHAILSEPWEGHGRRSAGVRGTVRVTLGVVPVGVGLLAVVVLAQAGVSSAVPIPIPIRVDFDAPAGCADADAFYAGVSARLALVRRARPGESATRLVVRLTRVGGKVHGELQLGGESDTRRVDGATCQEVVQVLALTAALAVNHPPAAAALIPPFVTEKGRPL